MVAKGQPGTSALGFTISLEGQAPGGENAGGFYFLLLGKIAGSKLSLTNIHPPRNLMSFCSLAAPCALGMKPCWVTIKS